MARTRSLKPGFFKNEQLAELPFQWRLLYAGLWTQADRVGRLEERPARLKAELFPYDDLKIEEGLASLADAKFIVRYEVNSVGYIAIPMFGKHQSPHVDEKEAGFPAPPRQSKQSPVQASGKPDTATGQARPVPGTSTSTGTSTGTALRARFNTFFRAYPAHKQVGEDAAWAIWKQRKPNEQLTTQILADVERRKRSEEWTKNDGLYVPNPKTYLKEGRWKDPVKDAPKNGNGSAHRKGAPRVSDRNLDQFTRQNEMKRLMREEGLSRKDAMARVGWQ